MSALPRHRIQAPRPPPLAHRVLPPNFALPTAPRPPASQPGPPAPDPLPSAAAADWFPPRHPTASDLTGHRCGARHMLTLVAYDITDPRRLHRAAKICEDWGMRVQYSVFECRLEADAFDRFWAELTAVIDAKSDKLTAFKICTKCAREIRSHGVQEHFEKVVAYVC